MTNPHAETKPEPVKDALRNPFDLTLLVQCPGCWAIAKAPRGVDWECDCGELMTVIDLRADSATPPPLSGEPKEAR